MENLLRSKEWWHLIEPGYVEPAAGARETEIEKTAREQLKLKDLKVKNYLFFSNRQEYFKDYSAEGDLSAALGVNEEEISRQRKGTEGSTTSS